ncbi:hypothetical protein [Pseudomonas sp. dw_358]|uniref:phage baseplate plug family protein n=1 Tax=Pseudomonas sp. dw_358 TaxID=2720083 RepID=UPI001BD3EB70|nr:hypothetical protein [Pseudomonas sp. dw_358]
MTTKTLSMPSGLAYFTFQASLSNTTYLFSFNWLTRFSYYAVSMYDGTGTAVFQGRGLHPNMDLLDGLQLGIGKLYLDGTQATVANLGVDNTLTWEY